MPACCNWCLFAGKQYFPKQGFYACCFARHLCSGMEALVILYGIQLGICLLSSTAWCMLHFLAGKEAVLCGECSNVGQSAQGNQECHKQALLMRPARRAGKSVSEQAGNHLFSKVLILELIKEMPFPPLKISCICNLKHTCIYRLCKSWQSHYVLLWAG